MEWIGTEEPTRKTLCLKRYVGGMDRDRRADTENFMSEEICGWNG